MSAQPNIITPLTTMYEAYIRAGFALVPITTGKGPTGAGWNSKDKAVTTLDQLNPSVGYGLAHAWSTPTTCAIDIDDMGQANLKLQEAGVDLLSLMQSPDSVMIDSGNPGHAKLLYTLPFGLTLPSKKINYTAPDGMRHVAYELRCASSNGLTVQDVLPSAINHPKTGRPYAWRGNGHFSRIPTIPTPILDLWQKLSTHDAEKVISTETVNASWDEIRDALQSIPAETSRDEWLTVLMALHHAGSQINELDQALTLAHQWSATATTKYKGPFDVDTVWRSFKVGANNVKAGSLFHIAYKYGYQRPIPDVTGMFANTKPVEPKLVLDGMRLPPPEMDFDLWPSILSNRAKEVADQVGCDPLVPLFAGLATVCGAINAETRLELLPGFEVPPILWLMTIGEPADKKTPGARPMMGVLYELEREDRPRFKRSLLEWEALDNVHQQSRKNYIQEAAKNTGTILSGQLDNETLPMVAPEPPPAPVDLKIVVQDITSQKLVRICADRPRGVLCHLDEMASWVGKLTDPRSGEDRSCWTKSYESDPYSMDRVGAENTIFASNMAVSIYGNIQPPVFRNSMRRMSDDGLLQRFIPGVLSMRHTKRGEPIPEMFSTKSLWDMKVREVFGLPKMHYRLDSQAYELFRDFQLWYEQTKRDERILNADPVYMQAFGKLEGTCGRITLLMHVMESPYNLTVSRATMAKAIQVVKTYLIPAYRYALGETGGLMDDGLEKWLADRMVMVSGIQQTITLSDIRHSAAGRLKDTPRHYVNQYITDAMEMLEQVQWVTCINDHKDKRTWAINPKLAEQNEAYRIERIKAKQRRQDESRAIVLAKGKYTPRRIVVGYDVAWDEVKYPD